MISKIFILSLSLLSPMLAAPKGQMGRPCCWCIFRGPAQRGDFHPRRFHLPVRPQSWIWWVCVYSPRKIPSKSPPKGSPSLMSCRLVKVSPSGFDVIAWLHFYGGGVDEAPFCTRDPCRHLALWYYSESVGFCRGKMYLWVLGLPIKQTVQETLGGRTG